LRVAETQVGGVACVACVAWRGDTATVHHGTCTVRVLVKCEYMSCKGLRVTSVPPRLCLYSHVVLDRRRNWHSARRGCCELTAPSQSRRAATLHCSTSSNSSVPASRRRSKIGTPHTSKAGHCRYVGVGCRRDAACLRRSALRMG
jgi:hypothetical protein